MIVKGSKNATENTIQHYENLLDTKNVSKYKITVILDNQLYENDAKTLALQYMYDKILADENIAARVKRFLGSKKFEKDHIAIPVNLLEENLSGEIDKAMRTVLYRHERNIEYINVGKHKMSNGQIAENIIDLLGQFCDVPNKGYQNLLKVCLRPQANVSVVYPLYGSAGKWCKQTNKQTN